MHAVYHVTQANRNAFYLSKNNQSHDGAGRAVHTRYFSNVENNYSTHIITKFLFC
jgi:hypothetical protein